MTFTFPGHITTPEPINLRQQYQVKSEVQAFKVDCDYVEFTPTHVTFWKEVEPHDELIVGFPLTSTTIVRRAEKIHD